LVDNIMTAPIAITIPEAVRLSGMSRTTIYEALKKRDLSAVKVGRRTLIPFADLQNYLAALPAYNAGA
jgi:excisionase family DNA binding protein